MLQELDDPIHNLLTEHFTYLAHKQTITSNKLTYTVLLYVLTK